MLPASFAEVNKLTVTYTRKERAIGKTTLDKVNNLAQANSMTMFEVLSSVIEFEELRRSAEKIIEFTSVQEDEHVENNNTDRILTVDVVTGEVNELCRRTLPSKAGNEAEGLTVFPMADGTFIHVLDYDKTVGVYLRHYKLTVGEE